MTKTRIECKLCGKRVVAGFMQRHLASHSMAMGAKT